MVPGHWFAILPGKRSIFVGIHFVGYCLTYATIIYPLSCRRTVWRFKITTSKNISMQCLGFGSCFTARREGTITKHHWSGSLMSYTGKEMLYLVQHLKEIPISNRRISCWKCTLNYSCPNLWWWLCGNAGKKKRRQCFSPRHLSSTFAANYPTKNCILRHNQLRSLKVEGATILSDRLSRISADEVGNAMI